MFQKWWEFLMGIKGVLDETALQPISPLNLQLRNGNVPKLGHCTLLIQHDNFAQSRDFSHYVLLDPSNHNLFQSLSRQFWKTARWLLTLWLPARMVYLQIEGLGAGFLDHSYIGPCPFVGFCQSVGPPVSPINTPTKERDGEGVREELVASENFNHPRSII